MKAGTDLSQSTTSLYEKSGASYVAENTKQGLLTGSQQITDYSKRNWEPIQKTLDDKGVTDAMNKTGA